MNKKNPELTGRTYLIFAAILLICMLISLKLGMEFQSQVDSFYNRSAAPDFSVFTKSNINTFCVQHGFQDGWAECNGVDFGVTCHKDMDFGLTKYQCFDLKEFYIFSGGASGGAVAGR